MIPTFVRVSLLAMPQLWARVAPFVRYGIDKVMASRNQSTAAPENIVASDASPTSVTAPLATLERATGSAPSPSSDEEPRTPKSDNRISYVWYLEWLNRVLWWASGACIVVVLVDSIERVPFNGRWHVVLLTPEMELSTQHTALTGVFEAHGLPAPESLGQGGAAASSNAQQPSSSSAQKRKDAAARRPKALASFDAKTRQTAQRVFDSLIAAIDPQLLRDRPEVRFQLHFLDSNEWNACALTAGAVVLYSGMAFIFYRP